MKVRRFLAGLAAAAMIAGTMSMSMTAWAEQAQQHEAYSYTAIGYQYGTENTYEFTKTLTVEGDANVPAVTFNFTVEKAEPVAGSASALPIYKTEGTPTIAPVTFTAGDSEASKTVSVDFTGVTFSEPGVYRYYITESADTPAYITNDPEAVRTLDVYVESVENELKIAGTTFIKGQNNTPPAKSDTKADLSAQKSDGYTNTYVSHDLTIAKNVTGNQASKDKYFKFTVAITNAGAGTRLNVDTANATTDAISEDTNGATTVSGTNPSGITCEADGSATVEVFLQNGESITITGLPDGAKYTITETKEDYTVADITAEGDEDGTATADTGVFADTDTGITGDTTVTYTNDKKGVVPTGVMVSIAGPAAAGAVIVGGVILLSVKKRREDRE
ncbi:MAG: hypothetical protein IJ639_10955 [Ruminococcus sp.]|nr:hypothetical protein [Ruminococcus sp.]